MEMYAILIELSNGTEVWTIAASTRQVHDAINAGSEVQVNRVRPSHVAATIDALPAMLNYRHVTAIVRFPALPS